MNVARYRSTGAILGTVALTLGGVFFVATPAHAAGFEVTDPGDSAATPGTLRWAMTQAETNAGPDTITVSYLGSIPAGATPLPIITQDLTVVGPGSDKLQLNATGSAFEVTAAVAVTISGLSIVAGTDAVRALNGGDLTIDDIDATGTAASGLNYAATTAADDVSISRVIVDGGTGDGVSVTIDGGTATLTDVTANTMTDHGIDIIGMSGSTLTLQNLSANDNGSVGIEIYLESGTGTWTGGGASGNTDVGIAIDLAGSAEFTAQTLTADTNPGIGIHAAVADTAVLKFAAITATNNTGTGVFLSTIAAAAAVEIADAAVSGNHAGGVTVGSDAPCEGVLVVRGSVINNNTDENSSGFIPTGGLAAAMAGESAVLQIDQTTIRDNDGVAGGILLLSTDGLSARISSSTLSGNTGEFVGGLLAFVGADTYDTSIEVVNSTISGNDGSIGALGVLSFAEEGAALAVTIANSTIVDNTSMDEAPGIAVSGATTVVSNSILAGNGAFADLAIDSPVALTIDHSLIQLPDASVDTALAAGVGNLSGIAPLLGPLADNGGPTKTHLPADNSPVVEAGAPSFSGLSTDQRGQTRVVGILDMGAVELGPMLAATGADASGLLAGGALFLAGGLALLVTRRRTRLG